MKHHKHPPQKVHTVSKREVKKSLLIALVSLGGVLLLSLLLLFAPQFVGKAIQPTVAGNAVQMSFDPLERDVVVTFSATTEVNGVYFELQGVGMDLCDSDADITWVDAPANPSYLQWQRFMETQCDDALNIFKVSKATVNPDKFIKPSADGKPAIMIVKLHLKKFIPSSFSLRLQNVHVMSTAPLASGGFNLFDPATFATYPFVNPAAGTAQTQTTIGQPGGPIITTPQTTTPLQTSGQQPAGVQTVPQPLQQVPQQQTAPQQQGNISSPQTGGQQDQTQNQTSATSTDDSTARDGRGSSCVPEWQCGVWGYCNAVLQQGRSCVDTKKCTIKVKSEVRSCAACAESWVCSSWSGCSNGKQTRNCVDEHQCNTFGSKPKEQQYCAEVKPYVQPPVVQPPKPYVPPVMPPTKKSFVELLLLYKWFIIIPLVLLLLAVVALLFLKHRKGRMQQQEGFNYDELQSWVQQGLRAGLTPEQLWQKLQQETSWKKEEFEKVMMGVGDKK